MNFRKDQQEQKDFMPQMPLQQPQMRFDQNQVIGMPHGLVQNPHAGYYQPSQLSIINQFWQNTMHEIQVTDPKAIAKSHTLPLARVKKVMKAEEDTKQKMMISGEAPALLAKACEIFILELTMRSWIHTEENKRRTLQRSDIATAISKNDVYDFLIDIVPREEANAQRGSVSISNATQAQDNYATLGNNMTNYLQSNVGNERD
ncbi:hypothetical protein MIR68_006559 [Amoeboaphelidium protococcarum]|nr:hypothetical protein MIR68_006559 [Amoeboaphelidium protococcarum]